MQTITENVTPAKAREWLDTNPNNRPRKQAQIDRLADDMKNDRWIPNGQPFRFDKAGVMLDGQHRCLAIIKSGVTLKNCLVVRGLDPESFTTMDIGSKRSVADACFVKHERYPAYLAAAIGIIACYLKDGTLDTSNGLPSQRECLDVLDTCPAIRDSVILVGSQKSKANRVKSQCLIPGGLLAAFHCLFMEKDGNLAGVFIDGMFSGFDSNLYPVFHLYRERMIANKLSKAKLPRNEIAALGIKAWNAERAKERLKQLKFQVGEQFPIIK